MEKSPGWLGTAAGSASKANPTYRHAGGYQLRVMPQHRGDFGWDIASGSVHRLPDVGRKYRKPLRDRALHPRRRQRVERRVRDEPEDEGSANHSGSHIYEHRLTKQFLFLTLRDDVIEGSPHPKLNGYQQGTLGGACSAKGLGIFDQRAVGCSLGWGVAQK